MPPLGTRETGDAFERDLRGRIFGVGASIEHASREVEEPGEVAGEQQLELIVVVRLCTAHELLIRGKGGIIKEWVWQRRSVGWH